MSKTLISKKREDQKQLKQLKKNDCFIAKSERFSEIHRVSIHLTENGQSKVLTRFEMVAQRNGGVYAAARENL